MDDEAPTIPLMLTPAELDIIKRSVRHYFNQQMRQADKYQHSTDNIGARGKSKDTKALLSRLEAMEEQSEAT